MDTNKEYSSAVAAAKDYFGGESATSFMKEWKELTDSDKAEIKDGLIGIGYKIKTL